MILSDSPSLAAKKAIIIEWLGTGSINIFGRPLAGKDTQAQRLSEWLHAPIIGGGDILRTKPEAHYLLAVHDSGALIPQDEFVEIMTPYLQQQQFAGHPLILSSVGRWHGEEEKIMAATQRAGHPLRSVIYVEVSEATAKARLLSDDADRTMRHDDTLQIFTVRMQEFAEKTLPVVDFYKQRNLVSVVNGALGPDDVELEIIDALYKRAVHQDGPAS